jgi:hypothetical protein
VYRCSFQLNLFASWDCLRHPKHDSYFPDVSLSIALRLFAPDRLARLNDHQELVVRSSSNFSKTNDMNFSQCMGILLQAAVSFSLLTGSASSEDGGADLIPTMSYERPVRIEAKGVPIDLGSHATTRCYD